MGLGVGDGDWAELPLDMVIGALQGREYVLGPVATVCLTSFGVLGIPVDLCLM